MQTSVKHFVRKILGTHLLLLALLLTVVTGAAAHIYRTARRQAFDQARARQTLLAEQTAHGIDGFYKSILGDLNLAKPDDQESDLPETPTPLTEAKPYQNFPLVRQAITVLLARQLQNRAYLFLVDEQMHTHTLGEDRPARLAADLSHGSRAPVPATSLTSEFEHDCIARFQPWLKDVAKADISDFAMIDQRGIKLVAVRLQATVRIGNGKSATFAPRLAGWLVAAVSARPIEQNFLADLSQHDISGAVLVDDSMMIMAASRHELTGTHLDQHSAGDLAGTLDTLKSRGFNGTQLMDRPFHIGSEEFQPALVSACPVEVMGKSWFVLVTSPMAEVDGVVTELSRKALFWAVFVALSMAAILVSTAAQLILSRLRMERVRHQLLKNEMRQARQIQLAWLPQKTKATCGGAMIDIASLNRPATHISGDFYNFFDLPDGRVAVVIGDVTGHGTAAAFLMATTQLLIRNTLPQYCDPGRCLDDVNSQLTNQVFNGQFVTMQILVIDPGTGDVAIATAGHPAPLMSDGHSFQSVNIEPQLVAGLDSQMQYPTERFRLRPGASLLLYTDGVVDTEDRAGDRLRLSGLLTALAGPVQSAEALLQKAVSAVNTFRHGRDLRDDLTLVAVQFLAQPKLAVPPRSSIVAPMARVG